jgi:hypothetical protein
MLDGVSLGSHRASSAGALGAKAAIAVHHVDGRLSNVSGRNARENALGHFVAACPLKSRYSDAGSQAL